MEKWPTCEQGPKYDHRVMYKKYTTPCPTYEVVVERHLEMAQPANKKQ